MRKFFLMLTAAMFVLTTSLYATEKSEKKLSVKPFSVINVVGSLKVVYEQGSTYEVSLVGDAAAFDQQYSRESARMERGRAMAASAHRAVAAARDAGDATASDRAPHQ